MNMTDRLSNITQEFLDSYHDIGGINHLAGPNLPSRQAIRTILEDVESLIFPGFKTEDALEHGSVRFIISEKISRLVRNLSNEINRSLCYERRITGSQNPEQMGDRLAMICRKEAETMATELVASIPGLRARIHRDVEAAYDGDPAAKSHEEVILSYPGLDAMTIYRVAHELWLLKVPLIPRLMTETAHSRTGIDIHPGATIGDWFFIDHGTGIVVGETTVIGSHVKLYQGVTLGALSVKKEEADKRRHPTLEDYVTVYSNATILGGRTHIGHHAVIGGNVWLTRSVSPYSVVTGKEADYVLRTPEDQSAVDFQI